MLFYIFYFIVQIFRFFLIFLGLGINCIFSRVADWANLASFRLVSFRLSDCDMKN